MERDTLNNEYSEAPMLDGRVSPGSKLLRFFAFFK
jgi:hypothetical protein